MQRSEVCSNDSALSFLYNHHFYLCLLLLSPFYQFFCFTAYDFTAQWSQDTSPGVVVDVTPPSFGSIWLEGVTNGESLRAFWDPVEESESELALVEWGVGSRLGSSDLMAWTPVTMDETGGSSLEELELADGQLVFISLTVR